VTTAHKIILGKVLTTLYTKTSVEMGLSDSKVTKWRFASHHMDI